MSHSVFGGALGTWKLQVTPAQHLPMAAIWADANGLVPAYLCPARSHMHLPQICFSDQRVLSLCDLQPDSSNGLR